MPFLFPPTYYLFTLNLGASGGKVKFSIMKKKVYEVPAMLVYKMAPTKPLCNSGGDEELGSRRLWLEDDEDIWKE